MPAPRLAVLSDIHGNIFALDAVLRHAELHGVDGYVVLGDLAAIGSHPVASLERLAALPNARIVQGNTDRYLVTGERPYPSADEAFGDQQLIERRVEVHSSFAWTEGALSHSDWPRWLRSLPLELRFDLADGGRVLATHVAPGRDDGMSPHPGMPLEEVAHFVGDCDVDFLLLGHTHAPLDVKLSSGLRVINPGSVGMPWAPDVRASYVILNGSHVTFHRVEYDIAAAVEALEQQRHPGGSHITSYLHGERKPWWTSSDGRAWAGLPPARASGAG